MSQFDLVIRNARIVDGTGAPARQGSLGVRGGQIAAIGDDVGQGAREIDGAGKVLAPGFIDIHTHFDPQICWDKLATPSLEHGVTTVVIGNCSLSLAPVRGDGRDKLVNMFGVIEDIKKQTFDAAVPFNWESFPEFLDVIRPGLGINVGAMIGHSALRFYVMGEASQERVATPEEIERMCQLVREAMKAGALGISSSYVDIDENMKPVPSRFADYAEKEALVKAMAESGRGVWQVVPYFPDIKQELENIRELGALSRAAGIVCSLQPVLSSPASPLANEILGALEEEAKQGGRVYGQVMPRTFDMNMRLSETSMLLYALPSWKKIMDMPRAQRRARFEDADTRERLVAEMSKAAGMGGTLPFLVVGNVKSPQNAQYVGRTLGEIAQTEGKPLGAVVLDLSLADDLDTEFKLVNVINADKVSVAQLLNHPLLHFGASDAGAHITQFCGTGDTTHMLEHFVRESGRWSLERAIYRMTGEVAKDWGLHDRGTLEVGKAADLVLFDLDTLHCEPETFVDDFPGEARRYVRRAKGYEAVVVNGAVVVRNDAYTEERGGRVV